MAITIVQEPRLYSAIGQKLMVVATSTNVAQDGFKYKVEIQLIIDTDRPNITTTEIIEFFVSPNPSGALVIDIAPIIEKYITNRTTYDTTPPVSIQRFNDEFTVFISDTLYQLTVTVHEFWIVGGILTDNNVDASFSDKLIFRASHQITDGYRPVTNDYFGTLGTTSRLLSDRKWNTNRFDFAATEGITADETAIFIPVREADFGVLTMGDKGEPGELDLPTTLYRYSITMYSDGGVPVTEAFDALDAAIIMHGGIYPANLNISAKVVSVKPNLFPDWKYYTLTNAGCNCFATYYFYNVDYYGLQDCNHEVVRIGWQNQRAGWDYFNFIKKNEESIQVERTRFSKVIGNYNDETFTFNSGDAGLTELQPIVQQYLNITSDWISEGEFEFLKSLIVSKVVHWVQDDGSFIPVVLETNDYTMARERNGKLKNLSLKLRLANNMTTV